LRRLNQRKED